MTTLTSTASSLQQRLRAAGVIATEVGLHGRFHCGSYRDDIESLISFCDRLPELQFPEASRLVLPTRSSSKGDLITQGKLHHIALGSILVEQSRWHQTFATVHSSHLKDKESLLITFGLERCVPPSFMKVFGSQVIHMTNLEEVKSRLSNDTLKPRTSPKILHGYSENDIAVVGMSCKVAGADDVSIVEAHGTGTPVGDPAEYESILKVFGGSIRSTPLAIGSVKGHIGHTECASGVIALLKTILMIQEGEIPPQASFETLSPRIKASPSDMIEIVTRTKKDWNSEFRAALINNYGASGSNASMVVTQPLQHKGAGSSLIHRASMKHPFWICGYDERSIREYSIRLKQFIQLKTISAKSVSLANLSFNVSRQSNRSLDIGLILSCSSVSELEDKLTACVNGDKSVSVTPHKKARSVILYFSGQVSKFIRLDQKVYDGVSLLRTYLDQCNSVLKSMGLNEIYLDIF